MRVFQPDFVACLFLSTGVLIDCGSQYNFTSVVLVCFFLFYLVSSYSIYCYSSYNS